MEGVESGQQGNDPREIEEEQQAGTPSAKRLKVSLIPKLLSSAWGRDRCAY